jgi:hypothetical protein
MFVKLFIFPSSFLCRFDTNYFILPLLPPQFPTSILLSKNLRKICQSLSLGWICKSIHLRVVENCVAYARLVNSFENVCGRADRKLNHCNQPRYGLNLILFLFPLAWSPWTCLNPSSNFHPEEG